MTCIKHLPVFSILCSLGLFTSCSDSTLANSDLDTETDTSSININPPKMEWHQVYNGSGEESHPHYVIETSDRGFLMIGETGFIDDNTAKIYVVKTDSSGSLIWEKEFGTEGYNLGNGCVETPDGNYVIAGTLNFDAVLIKVDALTGNTLSGWPKIWDLGSEDSFEAVEVTQDGGLIVTVNDRNPEKVLKLIEKYKV